MGFRPNNTGGRTSALRPRGAVIFSRPRDWAGDQGVVVGDMSPTKRSAVESVLAEGPGDLCTKHGVLGS